MVIIYLCKLLFLAKRAACKGFCQAWLYTCVTLYTLETNRPKYRLHNYYRLARSAQFYVSQIQCHIVNLSCST